LVGAFTTAAEGPTAAPLALVLAGEAPAGAVLAGADVVRLGVAAEPDAPQPASATVAPTRAHAVLAQATVYSFIGEPNRMRLPSGSTWEPSRSL
jgi:hypothetical protein